MKKIFENNFVEVMWDESKSYTRFTWKEGSITMSDDEYKKIISLWVTHAPYSCLVDARNLLYTISPEIQNWLQYETYQQAYDAGSRRVAFLVPNDLISSIAVEQLSDLSKEVGTVIIHYFSDEAQAVSWVLMKAAV